MRGRRHAGLRGAARERDFQNSSFDLAGSLGAKDLKIGARRRLGATIMRAGGQGARLFSMISADTIPPRRARRGMMRRGGTSTTW